MAMTGFELTPSEPPTNEIRSFTTVPHSDWIILELKKLYLKHFSLQWMLFEVGGFNDTFEENSLKAYFKTINFCVISVLIRSGFNGSSDFVTNSFGESWDSSCEKSWVPVRNHWVAVQKTVSPWLICNHTVNLKTDSKTQYYSLLK